MRLLLVFIFCQLSLYYRAQSWQQLANFPGSPRDDAAGFSIEDKHYCGTGRDEGFSCTRNFFRFNATLQQWENSTPLPDGENRQYATGFSYNGFGYILCGDDCSGNFLSSFWRFDPSTDQWTSMPNFPSAGRAGCVHFIIGDSLYLIGGQNASGILNEVWRYCFSTQEWIQKNNVPIPGIWRGIAFQYGGEGFIAAGKTTSNTWNAETWSFNPSNDSWNLFPNITFGERCYVGTVQRDSCLYVFGGLDPTDQMLTSFEKINLDQWTSITLPNFNNIARKGCVYFAHDSDFYLTTGIAGVTRLNETWKLENVLTSQLIDDDKISIYPIPCIEVLFLEVDPSIIGEFVYLCDELGKIVHIHRIQSCKDQLSLQHLPQGMYRFIYRNQSSPILKQH